MRIERPAIAKGTVCICIQGWNLEPCLVINPFFHNSGLSLVSFRDCYSTVSPEYLIPVLPLDIRLVKNIKQAMADPIIGVLIIRKLLELSERLGKPVLEQIGHYSLLQN